MAFLATAATAPSMGLVVGLGVGMVFVGLICLIVIISLMGSIMKLFGNKKAEATLPNTAVSTPAAAPEIENKQQFIAAVSAVLAEEMGTDVSGIRIVSVKKI